MHNKKIDISEVLKMFGVRNDEVGKNFLDFFNSLDMRYKKPTEEEKIKIINEIKSDIIKDKKVVDTPERAGVWSSGWKENLDQFKPNDLTNLSDKVCQFIFSSVITCAL